MNKFIVKNCPCLFTSYYADGRTIENECNLKIDLLCKDCNDCLFKQVILKCGNNEEVLNLFDIKQEK